MLGNGSDIGTRQRQASQGHQKRSYDASLGFGMSPENQPQERHPPNPTNPAIQTQGNACPKAPPRKRLLPGSIIADGAAGRQLIQGSGDLRQVVGVDRVAPQP